MVLVYERMLSLNKRGLFIVSLKKQVRQLRIYTQYISQRGIKEEYDIKSELSVQLFKLGEGQKN